MERTYARCYSRHWTVAGIKTANMIDWRVHSRGPLVIYDALAGLPLQ
jgi:hypothetical protein